LSDKKKVELKFAHWANDYNDGYELTIFVDGQELPVWAQYGGEPEDNSRHRSYKWVEEALKQVAESLGAEVIITETEETT
jgi:hypothetical protein